MAVELVNHPEHYNKPGQKECIEQMEELFGIEATATFALGSAYKYLYRAGDKTGEPEQRDIDKALWYYNWVKKKCGDYKVPLLGFSHFQVTVEKLLRKRGVLND